MLIGCLTGLLFLEGFRGDESDGALYQIPTLTEDKPKQAMAT